MFRLRLAKNDFKFSVAHFTLFPEGASEPLHGHNYLVGVEARGEDLDDYDLLFDIASAKREIRRLCDDLDESILLPSESRVLHVECRAGVYEVTHGSRRYTFPEAEVRLLPLRNCTMEALARYFWDRLARKLDPERVRELEVSVEETHGQSASYSGAIGSRADGE